MRNPAIPRTLALASLAILAMTGCDSLVDRYSAHDASATLWECQLDDSSTILLDARPTDNWVELAGGDLIPAARIQRCEKKERYEGRLSIKSTEKDPDWTPENHAERLRMLPDCEDTEERPCKMGEFILERVK